MSKLEEIKAHFANKTNYEVKVRYDNYLGWLIGVWIKELDSDWLGNLYVKQTYKCIATPTSVKRAKKYIKAMVKSEGTLSPDEARKITGERDYI